MLRTTKKYSREEKIEWLLSHTVVVDDSCLVLEKDFWSIGENGYPQINWNGRNLTICRFICFEPHEWSSNLVTRHRCHRKACINPEHLIKGTTADNWRDNQYDPFTMPDVYPNMDGYKDEDEENWWDDPSDEELAKEYETYLSEMSEIEEEK